MAADCVAQKLMPVAVRGAVPCPVVLAVMDETPDVTAISDPAPEKVILKELVVPAVFTAVDPAACARSVSVAAPMV